MCRPDAIERLRNFKRLLSSSCGSTSISRDDLTSRYHRDYDKSTAFSEASAVLPVSPKLTWGSNATERFELSKRFLGKSCSSISRSLARPTSGCHPEAWISHALSLTSSSGINRISSAKLTSRCYRASRIIQVSFQRFSRRGLRFFVLH